ncbi:iron chelate uptake ABC transporter family permease subunit [Sinorhizobium sp. BG8]|uniref:FecCD family ABC transporter permease n=1 Tax=Sinorhizobium sp. BG8 TaxID=2613773 RepID=UPI00193D962E|nr:iron chelate uptake ABC transporter family permease subunit [Sinorhizobium sp. BG8]QRM54356.1 iron chelate uptake ABC transporter family permease subunit [Sinorhizobium sp. BG8]
MTGSPSPVGSGRPAPVLRWFGERLSLRFDMRVLGTSLMLIACCLAVGAAALTSGRFPLSLAHVVSALFGQAEGDVRMVVVEWRLPRLALGFLLGGALGLSGAIFQSLTRNPLGSPDIIGFSTGSYTGALAVILLFSGGYYETAAGGLAGGMLTAAAVYLLAYRRGVQGFRLIIVGIGVSAMLSAVNAWMIREANLQVAMSAAIWGAGSLNGLGFEQLRPVLVVLLVLVPLALLLSRPMRQLELGDDVARASGVSADRIRLGLIVVGVALTAIVTAAAGPIAFIALTAPQIARRIARTPGTVLLPSALTGSLLLVGADWAAQHAFSVQLPVGVMTVSIGGLCFIWLLIREGRT